MSEPRSKSPIRLCPEGFELPADLIALIETGVWPTEPHRWDGEPRIHSSVVDPRHREDPDLHLHFCSPPFKTPRDHIELFAEYFWQWPCASPSEIDHDRTLVIGDLGLGNDAPIILDYSDPGQEPRVRFLKWGKSGKGDQATDNHWVERSRTFRGFAMWIGLIKADPTRD
jgi:hypothetical protein